MKLTIFTLVLDGMPWITKHLDILKATNLDWKWIIVHGAAMNNGSTRWCQPQEPRLSTDGTTEYLHSIQDERVTLIENIRWNSKDQQCNAALRQIKEPCVLMEIDSDETWKPSDIKTIHSGFCSDPILQAMKFACRYFVGEDLITKGEHCYGDMDYEWNRAWKFKPGMRFKSHEPPILDQSIYKEFGSDVIGIPTTYFIDKDVTRKMGLVFDHYAYATEAQVAYKEKFYGYKGLLEGWRRLQEQRMFPVFLKDFFPQCRDNAMVVRA